MKLHLSPFWPPPPRLTGDELLNPCRVVAGSEVHRSPPSIPFSSSNHEHVCNIYIYIQSIHLLFVRFLNFYMHISHSKIPTCFQKQKQSVCRNPRTALKTLWNMFLTMILLNPVNLPIALPEHRGFQATPRSSSLLPNACTQNVPPGPLSAWSLLRHSPSTKTLNTSLYTSP